MSECANGSRSVEQLRLANGLCRFAELAERVR
jgi:hypothetical protein